MIASIHIIIVNWNTGRYLRDCLASIASSEDAEAMVARVTVIDNASSDDSARGLDDLKLPLEVIRNGRNIGFAAGCNQGAADSTSDYLLFLNPDTRLSPDALTTVRRFMQSEEAAQIGICGVQMVDESGRTDISCARFPSPRVLVGEALGLHLVLPRLFPRHQLIAAELRESRVVDQVIGAFFFVRRALFTELDGFDERYFMYFEEVDFALRARRRGARSYFLREASVFHAGNVSSNQVRGTRLYHSLRSRLVFAYQHWPRRQADLLAVLTFAVELPARLTKAAVRGSRSDISATFSGYRLLGADVLRRARAWK